MKKITSLEVEGDLKKKHSFYPTHFRNEENKGQKISYAFLGHLQTTKDSVRPECSSFLLGLCIARFEKWSHRCLGRPTSGNRKKVHL